MNTLFPVYTVLAAITISSIIAIILAPNFRKLKDVLWQRYLNKSDYDRQSREDRHDADRLNAYIERIIDRQINKARGILPFNSIYTAVVGISIAMYKDNPPINIFNIVIDIKSMLGLTMILLSVSNLLCLCLMFVVHSTNQYGSFEAELRHSLDLLTRRANLIQMANIISCTALTVLMLMLTAILIDPRISLFVLLAILALILAILVYLRPRVRDAPY